MFEKTRTEEPRIRDLRLLWVKIKIYKVFTGWNAQKRTENVKKR